MAKTVLFLVFTAQIAYALNFAFKENIYMPPDILPHMVLYGIESPQDFLLNACTMAIVNKTAGTIFTDELIAKLFLDAHKDKLSEKFPDFKGDTVFHFLARFRRYKILEPLMITCKNEEIKKPFMQVNFARENILLTLIKYKTAEEDSNIFNHALSLSVDLLGQSKNTKSHNSSIFADANVIKITEYQFGILENFKRSKNHHRPKLSKAFINAMDGTKIIGKRRWYHYLYREKYPSYLFDFKSYGYHKETILHVAARNGHWQYLLQMLKHPQAHRYVNARNAHHQTPLMCAARGGVVLCLDLLIKFGANLEDKDEDQRTALLWAAHDGHLSAVQFLVRRGANLKIIAQQKGILEFASISNAQDIIDYLLEEKLMTKKINGKPLMAFAAANNYPKLIKKLLEHSFDIEEKNDDNGSRPIMFAAQHGALESLKMLIDNKARIDEFNDRGQSIFYWICGNHENSCRHCNEKNVASVIDIVVQAMVDNKPNLSKNFIDDAYHHLKEANFADQALTIKEKILAPTFNMD